MMEEEVTVTRLPWCGVRDAAISEKEIMGLTLFILSDPLIQ